MTCYFSVINNHIRIFQGARHSATGMMGRDAANPTAILLAAAKMLRHMHLEFHAKIIQDSVEKVIKTGKVSEHLYEIEFPMNHRALVQLAPRYSLKCFT